MRCNTELGAKKIAEKHLRRAFLYEKTARKIASGAFWADEEIRELGRGLRAMIESSSARHARAIEYLRGLEQRMLGDGEAPEPSCRICGPYRPGDRHPSAREAA